MGRSIVVGQAQGKGIRQTAGNSDLFSRQLPAYLRQAYFLAGYTRIVAAEAGGEFRLIGDGLHALCERVLERLQRVVLVPGHDGLLAQRDVRGRFRQILAKAALVKLGNQTTLQFVTLVEKCDAESEGDIIEDLGVLGPRDHRARTHDGRQITVDEGVARQVGDTDHVGNGVAALFGVVGLALGEDDVLLLGMRQIVQRNND